MNQPWLPFCLNNYKKRKTLLTQANWLAVEVALAALKPNAQVHVSTMLKSADVSIHVSILFTVLGHRDKLAFPAAVMK